MIAEYALNLTNNVDEALQIKIKSCQVNNIYANNEAAVSAKK